MTGTLVLSFDAELVWGSFDHLSPQAFAERYPDVRGTIRRLLDLLDQYEIPATWAVVGHLFLDSCERGADGRAHPECLRPNPQWYPGDWLGQDPCTDRQRDPLWYGDDVLDWLQQAKVPHEIGSHSFSHVVFGDPGCSADVARSELRASREAAARRGITLRSFVFPRNVEGHHDVLREFGYVAYRGAEPTGYRHLPTAARRASHFASQAAGIAPPVSDASEAMPRLWNIPGSMLWLHRGGVRRFIPLASRVRRARAGLHRAAAEGRIFHLWCHPFNFCVDRDAMLAAFADVLREAARMRARGELDIVTMGDLADRLSNRASVIPPSPAPTPRPTHHV